MARGSCAAMSGALELTASGFDLIGVHSPSQLLRSRKPHPDEVGVQVFPSWRHTLRIPVEIAHARPVLQSHDVAAAFDANARGSSASPSSVRKSIGSRPNAAIASSITK